MAKEERKRKANGDVDFGSGPFDWKGFQWWRYTYVFHYFDPDFGYYRPYFNLNSHEDEKLNDLRQDPNFAEVELYRSPDHPPYDFYISYHNGMLRMLIDHFKEVFEERAFLEGHVPTNTFFTLILPKPLYHQLLNFINDFQLLSIRVLILEIIAIAQRKYVESVSFWEQPEQQRIITTAGREAAQAIKLIDKTDRKSWLRQGQRPAELLHVSFAFQDETIKISHPWLAKEFIESFKDQYSKFAYKNWRLDLERYPERFRDNEIKAQFKYRLAKSLYNLLTKEGFFPVSDATPYPNDLMLCIARIIEFVLIPVGAFDETDDVKRRHIRNWLRRNEFEEAITYMDLPVDIDKLGQYFGDDFIKWSDDAKRADAISLALYLTKRFNLEHLTAELAHIAQALRRLTSAQGFQLLSDSRRGQSLFPEYNSLRKLIETLQEKRPLNSLSFRVEGDEQQYQLEERLPLHLIESALKAYMESHKEEFENDIIKATYNTLPDGGYQIQYLDRFNLPQERFSVRFTTAFYQYLLEQAPPADNEYMPSSRYYAIIAVMLQRTWFFYQQWDDERIIVEKVKRWHKLGTQPRTEQDIEIQ